MNKEIIIKAKYFKNELNLDDIPEEEYTTIKDLRDNLRDNYNDWVANVRFNNVTKNINLVEYFQWKGMSSWWLNSLTFKDTELNNEWINRLMIVYLSKHYKKRISLETDDKVIYRSITKIFPDLSVSYLRSKNLSWKQKINIILMDFIYYYL